MPRRKTPPFKVSLELEGEKRISGNNLFELLEQINKHGSISQAAAELNFSYRYAWGLIKEAEHTLSSKLVIKQAGGAAGGGSSLTQEGSNLLQQYQAFKEEVNGQLHRFISKKESAAESPMANGTPKQVSSMRHLLLASTMEPVETGLLDLLEEAFYQSSGILVRHIAVGSGRALEIAREGRVDMVLTHAPELEERFIAEGWGKKRLPLMSNNFVIVGPRELSSQLELETNLLEIFKQIARCNYPFISRGDESGTYLREQRIWKAANIEPALPWYQTTSGVAGNLGIINLAREKRAFALVDRASYLLSQVEGDLTLVADQETGERTKNQELLQNVFSLIPVAPEKAFKTAPSQENKELEESSSLFIQWLQGEGKNIITSFGKKKFGSPLFYPV